MIVEFSKYADGKFDVGDKVKIPITKSCYPFKKQPEHASAVVLAKRNNQKFLVIIKKEIYGNNEYMYYLNVDLYGNEHYLSLFLEEDLELYDSEPFEQFEDWKNIDDINESRGYPDPIAPYFDLIYDTCWEKMDKYLNKKGKFSNYNEKIIINYNQIKDIVSNEDFIKYPVEEIELKFGVNLNKYIENDVSFSSSFYRYNDVKDDGYSYWIESKSGIVEKAIRLKLDIGILIGREANSVDIGKIKNFLRININHELTHSYEHIYNTNPDKSTFIELFSMMSDSDIIKKSPSFSLFLWLIYKSSKTEMNADIAGAHSITNLSDLKKEEIWMVINVLGDFEPQLVRDEFIKEMDDMGYEGVDEAFGEIFVSLYKTACSSVGSKPKPEILKLKDKNCLYVFKYWDKKFIKASTYLKKKLLKNIQSR